MNVRKKSVHSKKERKKILAHGKKQTPLHYKRAQTLTKRFTADSTNVCLKHSFPARAEYTGDNTRTLQSEVSIYMSLQESHTSFDSWQMTKLEDIYE